MNNLTISQLYLIHIIEPLEKIIKSPEFMKIYTLEEQQMINQFLLEQYRNLESIIKDEIYF